MCGLLSNIKATGDSELAKTIHFPNQLQTIRENAVKFINQIRDGPYKTLNTRLEDKKDKPLDFSLRYLVLKGMKNNKYTGMDINKMNSDKFMEVQKENSNINQIKCLKSFFLK